MNPRARAAAAALVGLQVAALGGASCATRKVDELAAPADAPHVAKAGIAPAATNTAWAWDWGNSTTCADDRNTCTTATCGAAGSFVGPCLHFGEIKRRLYQSGWPRFRQPTTFTALSSAPDNTDVVNLEAYLENQAYVVIQGALPAPVQTGTLGSVINVSPLTNSLQLTQAVFGPGLAAGELVVNTTHPSRAWLWANVSGNTWTTTQPMTPNPPPMVTPTFGPKYVQWQTGDAYAIYQPINVPIANLSIYADTVPFTVQYTEQIQLYQLTVSAPSGEFNLEGFNSYGSPIGTSEVSIQRYIVLHAVGDETYPLFDNSWIGLAMAGTATVAIYMQGGAFACSDCSPPQLFAPDGNVIMHGQHVVTDGWSASGIGQVYIADRQLETIPAPFNGAINFRSLYPYWSDAGAPDAASVGFNSLVWGPGGLDIRGRALYSIVAPSCAIFHNDAGVRLHNSSTACNLVGTSTITCGIPLDCTHLDTSVDAGGFQGPGGVTNAFILGGGAITNGSP
jgi:hypothetical protein